MREFFTIEEIKGIIEMLQGQQIEISADQLTAFLYGLHKLLYKD